MGMGWCGARAVPMGTEWCGARVVPMGMEWCGERVNDRAASLATRRISDAMRLACDGTVRTITSCEAPCRRCHRAPDDLSWRTSHGDATVRRHGHRLWRVRLRRVLPLTLPQVGLFAVLLVAACLTSVWKSHPADLPGERLYALRLPCCRFDVASAARRATRASSRSPAPGHGAPLKSSRAPRRIARFQRSADRPHPLAHGACGLPAPSRLLPSAGPLVGAMATYLFVNTALVAGAIALSTVNRSGRSGR